MHMCMWILHVLFVNFNVNHTLITRSFQCSWMIFSHQFSIDPGAKRLVKAHMKMACKRNGVCLKLFHSSINTYTRTKGEPCELNSIFYRRYLSYIYIHIFRYTYDIGVLHIGTSLQISPPFCLCQERRSRQEFDVDFCQCAMTRFPLGVGCRNDGHR